VGDDSWYLNARLLDLDYTRNVGTARDATLEFQGVPILYTPWIDFPLTSSRKSGLLTPTIKTGSNGFELVTPYYFNLAPNYDATLYPRLISRRGLMMGGEFRYLMPDYSGSLFTEQLPYDRTTGTNRYSWAVQHQQKLAPSLDFNAVVNYVSDDNYFKDFSSRVGIASNVNLERSATFNYSKGWDGGGLNSMLRVQRYQTLQDPLSPTDQPYGRLPQLTLSAQQSLPSYFSTQVYTELTRFAHGNLISSQPMLVQPDGSRFVAYPSVSWNYDRPWGFLRSKFGVHYTEYQLDNEQVGTVTTGSQVITGGGKTRTLPIFSVDSGLTFERPSGLFGQDLTQTLEPRLYYVLIPTRDQSNLPLYDTSENDVGFAQLFTENRFSGQDRINGANQLTAAVTNRFIDNGNGLERLRVAVGQRFYFRRQDIDLSGKLIERQVNGSDLLFSAGGDITRAWRFDSSYQYSEQDKKTKVYDLGLRFNPAAGKVISAHYRYGLGEDFDTNGNTATLHQIDLAAQWPLTSKLYLLARENYSLRDNKTLESLAGIEYNSGCWSLRLVGQRYVTDLINTKSAFFVQLEFKDLGNIGNDPRDTLRLSIPGYSSTTGYSQNTMKPSTL
jgi:LPS-assembly protein